MIKVAKTVQFIYDINRKLSPHLMFHGKKLDIKYAIVSNLFVPELIYYILFNWAFLINGFQILLTQ